MSVLITNMEMPDCCDACQFGGWSNLHQTCSCKLRDYEPGFPNFSLAYQQERSAICPLEEPMKKQGRWIEHPGGKFVGFPYTHYECSECRDFEPERRPYCPNCGAEMEESDGHEH